MTLTREYKKTVVARIQRDEKFARALYAEALNALLEGETAPSGRHLDTGPCGRPPIAGEQIQSAGG